MPNPFVGGPMSRASHGLNKPKNRKKTLKRLGKYLFPYRFRFIIVILLTIFSSGLELLGPYFSGEAIDLIAASETNHTQVDISKIVIYCLLMLVCYVLSSIILYVVSMLMVSISKKIIYRMREESFASLMNSPISYFDKRQIGDIISVVSYDIDTVNTSLTSDIVQIVSSVFTVIFSFVMMLVIKPILVLIFVITIPMCLLFSRFLIKKTRILYSKRSYQLGQLNAYAEEAITGNKSIKSYGSEESIIKCYKKENDQASKAYYKAEYYGCYMGPGVNFFNNLSISLVCIFGAVLNVIQGFSYGSIAKFVQYSRKFSGPINETANIFTDLQSALSASERVFDLIDSENEIEDAQDSFPLINPKGDFIFNHIRFGYLPGKTVINDLSLKVKEGEQIALVGQTGCGKTTLVNLLLRFYDINQGNVYFDGNDIRQIKKSDLRKSFAMVLQDTWLFEGTVFENLTYGNADASLDEVISVCKLSHIHDFIMSLKDGYNTILKEGGTNISKGQKQLLTIARAMLLKANILILDEATSNVDTRTEKIIQDAMKNLMKNKTCFIIAHRLSTIVSSNKIIVMKDGNIKESGTHQELMKKQGYYYTLFNSQFD